ncbi:MAG: hypothetical protein K2X57_28800 [Xanthobacteraceae bacterium]|nr:hypothetical protein [Xanthobacteraceae bacterium]
MPIVNKAAELAATQPGRIRKLSSKSMKSKPLADTVTVSARVTNKLRQDLEDHVNRCRTTKNDVIIAALVHFLNLSEDDRALRLHGEAMRMLIAAHADLNRIGNLFALEAKKTHKINDNCYAELEATLKQVQAAAAHLCHLRDGSSL